jgi:hypothetical protein
LFVRSNALAVPEVMIRPPDGYHMDGLTYTDDVAKASARSGFSHAGARPTSRKKETASMNVPEYVMGFSLVAI